MATRQAATTAVPTRQEIEAFAADWYAKLDQHVPADEVAAMVADDIELHLPEGVLRGVAAFREWYEGVIRIFFDEVHTLSRVAASSPGEDGTVPVGIVVNWQARRWRPPAPRSEWIGFDAYQDWTIRRDEATGRCAITRYVVNELRPMPGSPPL